MPLFRRHFLLIISLFADFPLSITFFAIDDYFRQRGVQRGAAADDVAAAAATPC